MYLRLQNKHIRSQILRDRVTYLEIYFNAITAATATALVVCYLLSRVDLHATMATGQRQQ